MRNDPRILELLDVWQEAQAAGRPLTVEELCRDCPELIAPFRAQLVVLERIERMGATPRPEDTADFTPKPSPDPREPVAATPTAMIAEFRVLNSIGHGGFGTVYRVEDVQLQRHVALKVLRASALTAETRAAFLREARALAAIHHDHVVPIYEVGEADGQLFLVMPLLTGETLAAKLEREGALPAAEVQRLGRELAAGLAALHAKGLVHRDLKPGNIWLEMGTNRVKVLDLGLATEARTEHAIAGTPAYMSPEQVAGEPLDARSDLFSLGVVLYECATGQRPFHGDTLATMMQAITTATPLPVREVNPAVPASLATLIADLLAKRVAARPLSARSVQNRLAARSRRVRPWLVGVALAVAVVLGVGGYIASRPGPTPDPTPTPAPPEAPTEALRVRGIEVRHFASAGQKVHPMQILGKESFTARLDDEIDVRVELTRPAYSYIVLARPDGVWECIEPQEPSVPPSPTATPHYPSLRRSDRYVLEEGAGLWLVVVIVSEQPLPSFHEWQRTHPFGPWSTSAGKPGTVWYDDGQVLETLVEGQSPTRGDRASRTTDDRGRVVQVVDELRAKTQGTIAAVGFTVVKP